MHRANDKQVGGDHYSRGGEIQHWDWVEANGMGYLEGNATKYITRWRNKNGAQDLKKALHYIEKLRELHLGKVAYFLWTFAYRYDRRYNRARPTIRASAFAKANNLGPEEAQVCNLLLNWSRDSHLNEAWILTKNLLVEAERQ